MENLLIFQRWVPVLLLRTLGTSSRGLKKDYPWSDDLEKLPDLSITSKAKGKAAVKKILIATKEDAP